MMVRHIEKLKETRGTLGVIVPYINQSFFSEAIAGIEEICLSNNYNLIICQSNESYIQECKAIDTLIQQHVDCILISISAETHSYSHLETIINHNIELVQFDRCTDSINTYKVVNDNKESSYNVVKNLINEGYKRIAFIGGPEHLTVFSDRKKGYIKAVKEACLAIPCDFIIEDALSKEKAFKIAEELLRLPFRPDAFFTVSDHQSLGILQAANSLGIKVPELLGIFGFANEAFTEIIKPTLSSVNQKSKELGKHAANLYFKSLIKLSSEGSKNIKETIISEIIVRESSSRKSTNKASG